MLLLCGILIKAADDNKTKSGFSFVISSRCASAKQGGKKKKSFVLGNVNDIPQHVIDGYILYNYTVKM